MDYSYVVKDALQRVETLLLTNKKHDYGLDIIAEFIFQEKKIGRSSAASSNKHNAAINTLNLTQEFQLVIVLCDYFAERHARGPQTAATCNALFLSLFGATTVSATSPSASRSRVLAKLVSTAISSRLQPLLSAVGTWMQQMGPTSAACAELARRLVEDFVHYSRRSRDQLGALPQLAPNFTVNLITACTELYLLNQDNLSPPPAVLLDVFTSWIGGSVPLLSLVGGQQQTPALPAGAIAMPVVSPFAGLIRWCVLAPLCTMDEAVGAASAYSQLHLAVLQSLVQSGQQATKTTTATPPSPGINALHLCAIVAALKQMPSPMAVDANDAGGSDERLQQSLERFAQSVQLALAARTITGNVTHLMCRMETLPRNPLLQIVIRANRATM